MKVEYVIRKNRKVITTQALSPAVAKKPNSHVLGLAKAALAEKLKAKGKHRVEIRRGGEKVGEWTCVPAKLKKKSA